MKNQTFKNNGSGWIYTNNTSFVNISGENKPPVSGGVRYNSAPNGLYRIIQNVYFDNGKKGDVLSMGGWAKADSVNFNPTTGLFTRQFTVTAEFYYNGTYKGTQRIPFNYAYSGWQFTSGKVIAPTDYTYVSFLLEYNSNANTAYFAMPYLYKEEYGQTYTYDDFGNIISSKDLADSNSSFAYYKNEIAQMLTPTGSRYLYNYTDDGKKQLYSALSSSGQEYKFKYDSKGNVTESEITARKPVSSLEAGKKYMIVNAYSGLALDSGSQGTDEYPTSVYKYTAESTRQHWQLGSGGEDGIFTFKAVTFEDKYLDVSGGKTTAGTRLQIYYSNGTISQKFKPVRQSDGTYVIYTRVSNCVRVLDGQYDNPTEVIQSQTVKQADCDSSSPKASQRWYFYPAEEESSGKIISKAEYTQNGNYLSKTTDSRGGNTLYNHNGKNGALLSSTDPNGNVTAYTYNPANNALLSVTSGGVTNSYTYENNILKSITAGGNAYTFDYDVFLRRTGVKIGSRVLSQNSYDSYSRISRMTYGNGTVLNYSYDSQDNPIAVWYNNDRNSGFKYSYTASGGLAVIRDYINNLRTKYTYDLSGRLVKAQRHTAAEYEERNEYAAVFYRYEDKTNRLSGISRRTPAGTLQTDFVYGNTASGQTPDAVYTVKHNGTPAITYTYDMLGRLSGKTTAPIGKTASYTYLSGGHGDSSTTTLVGSITQNGITTSYAYDANGNITEIKENGVVKESYTYDSLNQLKTATRNNITTSYEYDNNGNITEVKQNGAVIKSYAYGDSEWKDLLTGFNGQSISYDVIGNPLTYRGKTMTWERGRRLAGITEGTNAIAYTYDDSGLRLSKTVNGQKTTYYVLNGELLGQQTQDGGTLQFLFDESGAKYGFIYNGAPYYYNLNLQGDVTGIFDSTGADVVQYAYDEWGKLLSLTGTLADTVGQINPIRYRGYYYDSETRFYYLQSRYYDPETGRFINADGYVTTGQGVNSYNMFIYCLNNPILMADTSGTRPDVSGDMRRESAEQRKMSFACINPNISYKGIVNKRKNPTKVSAKGRDFIASYEAYFSTPYDDGFGNITVGYGHVIQKGENYSSLNKAQALELLSKDLSVWEKAVYNYSESLSIVWDQNEYDAFVSLAFNAGYNFKKVMNAINDGVDPYTAFGKVIYANGQPLLGLYRRRMDEADIFVRRTYARTYRGWGG